MADGSRCDVLTPSTAFEVEWAKKWKESIAQALWYSMLSDRAPGVALLLRKKPTEPLSVARCAGVCAKAGVRLVVINTVS